MAQFFEIRYSKNFRLFTGGLAFLAGIANFGIIPAVGARCFIYFLGLPDQVRIFSHLIPTYVLLMALFLSITLTITLSGGFITVMITDCVEGIISQLFYIVIIATLIFLFPWSDISATLADAPPGKSLLNPFDSLGLRDFNIWYVLMGLASSLYGTMAWQMPELTMPRPSLRMRAEWAAFWVAGGKWARVQWSLFWPFAP